MVYTVNFAIDNQAADKIITISEQALEMLEKDDDYQNIYHNREEYEIIFCEYISRAYETKVEFENGNLEKQMYYEKIENYCKRAIVLLDEEKETTRKTKLAMMQKLCKAYIGMSEQRLAEQLYEEMVVIFSKESDDRENFFIGHMKLLCEMEKRKNNEIEKWNLSKIKKLYQKAIVEVPEIKNNSNWQKILEDIGEDNLEK